MSVIGSNILAGASGQGGGYNLTNSLRFRSSASANLSRTLSSSGSATIFTWSGWVKRGSLSLSDDQWLFASTNYITSGSGNPLVFQINFKGTGAGASADKLAIVAENNATSPLVLYTTQVFRDPSAWYHIVVAVDTTQATDTNRVKLYVNGSQVTSFSTTTYPAQNTAIGVNQSGNTPRIGAMNLSGSATRFFDGYQTELNFIDGQALTPSSFGETSTTTGVWQPKKYAGTYGTNGFYLPFSNNASTSTLGNDFSGNGNNWTTNNISLTAGSTYDSMTDVPTLTSATAANYPTLNPLDIQTTSELPSSGNLNANGGNNIRATMCCPSTGKYYFEYTRTNTTDSAHVGVMSSTSAISSLVSGCILYRNDGNVYVNNSVVTTYASFTTNDVIGVGMDMDTGNIYFSKNNTYQGAVGLASAGITVGNVVPMIRNNTGATASVNFGQIPFVYSPSSGFVSLNTFNLPTPTIGATASTQAGKYMNTVTYTGNGASSRAITGVGFQPDLVWTKSRSGANPNVWIDSNRGSSKYLISNSTAAEGTNSTLITSFDSDGFTIGSDDLDYNNYNGDTYVAWNWRASNATAVTNTSGSITSSVSANTTSGFSVVTYTGNAATSATIGHGLGVAPDVVVVKNRQTATTSTNDWNWYFRVLGTGYLICPSNNGYNSGTNRWNGTNPTSTVFSVGGDSAHCNNEAINYVAYCWSAVAGYSKFGSYTGNGDADGTFVYTGFRPRYFMVKRTDTAGYDWILMDTARDPINVATQELYANLSNAEGTAANNYDILSNGFKPRRSNAAVNASGGTYVYMAFAENPFKYSLAR